MFEKFGNFNAASEINELAINLRKEKKVEEIKELAKENGIDMDLAEAFIDGDIFWICDETTAAIGKIEIEAESMEPVEIMEDWIGYLKTKCFEDKKMAAAVRRNDKSLIECIGALLSWSFKNQKPVQKEIIKAADIELRLLGFVKLGIPGMGTSKKIMENYYLG